MPEPTDIAVRVGRAHTAVRRVRTVDMSGKDCSLRRLPGIVGRLHQGMGLSCNGDRKPSRLGKLRKSAHPKRSSEVDWRPGR